MQTSKRTVKEWIIRSIILLVGPVAGVFLPINGKMVDRIVGEKKE